MKEGFWINYKTGKTFQITEHELWIRTPENAKKLGITPGLIKTFEKFIPVKDRDEFLLFILKNASVMRVRGHGISVTFEYNSCLKKAPIKAISRFASIHAGPLTNLVIHNFSNGENISILYSDSFKIK